MSRSAPCRRREAARCGLCRRPSTTEIEETAEAIRSHGVKCFARASICAMMPRFDAFHARGHGGPWRLRHPGECRRRFGAGGNGRASGRDLDAVLDINLNGCYRTIKRCFPGMIERRWGRIINIASTAAEVGCPRYSAYCASKSALLGLTRCVALEGAEHGVTCNAINPGSVGTEMMRLGSLQAHRAGRPRGDGRGEFRQDRRPPCRRSG